MWSDRKFLSVRIFLFAIGIIAVILPLAVIHRITSDQLIQLITEVFVSGPVLLLIIAIIFPYTVFGSSVMTFSLCWSLLVIFSSSFMMIMNDDFINMINSRLGKSLGIWALILCLYLCISVILFASRLVRLLHAWAREYNIRKRKKDIAGGAHQMKKGLITFLYPRQGYILTFLFFFLDIMFLFFSCTLYEGEFNISLIILFPAVILSLFFAFVSNIRKYNAFYRDLSSSGILKKYVSDFYRGKDYLDGEMVLGHQYIFFEGRLRAIDCNNIKKISHEIRRSYNHAPDTWKLIITETDGEEFSYPFPYTYKEKIFEKSVSPILNEIKHRNPGILISDPGTTD